MLTPIFYIFSIDFASDVLKTCVTPITIDNQLSTFNPQLKGEL